MNDKLKEIDKQLAETVNDNPMKKVAFLEDLEFTPENIKEFVKDVPREALDEINE